MVTDPPQARAVKRQQTGLLVLLWLLVRPGSLAAQTQIFRSADDPQIYLQEAG